MLNKRDWILLFLHETPLDRIRLMEALFLFWYRSGKAITDYFAFEPYLYGPCSFEVYSILDELTREGLLVQPLQPVQQWARYYLTAKGRQEAEKVIRAHDPKTIEKINEIAREVSHLGFYELLRKVYTEAPEFAKQSILRDVAKL